jgi:hypothetical protein
VGLGIAPSSHQEDLVSNAWHLALLHATSCYVLITLCVTRLRLLYKSNKEIMRCWQQ